MARLPVFVLAGLMVACSSPAKERRETEQVAAPVSSKLTAQVNTASPEAKLRGSFQPCVDKAAGATWPTQDCIEREFEHQDARLNKAYQALMKALPEQGQTELRTSQRQWLSSRDADCPWDDDTEGQGRRIESNYCVMEKTALRAGELEIELNRLGYSIR
jgi:uncharacterized protein YecT (DUF1311 family)